MPISPLISYSNLPMCGTSCETGFCSLKYACTVAGHKDIIDISTTVKRDPCYSYVKLINSHTQLTEIQQTCLTEKMHIYGKVQTQIYCISLEIRKLTRNLQLSFIRK